MITTDYRFILELFSRDSKSQDQLKQLRSLGQVEVPQTIFRSAQEWCHFQGIREETLSPFTTPGPCTIEPVWDEEQKEPVLAAFRMALRECVEGGVKTSLFGREYFKPLALDLSQALIKRGDIDSADQVYFRVLAMAPVSKREADTGSGAPFTVETIPQPLDIVEKELANFRAGAVHEDAPHGNDECDLPVFIPRKLLAEAFSLTRQAGSQETGGVLIGCLNRDPETRVLFLEVTAQIPARYSKSELQRLTFTADTWTAVQQAVELRDRGELWLGWWHSHSYLKETCADCERKSDGSCRSSALFLSDEDCNLHHTIFNPSYTVALVISDSPCSGLEYALYGWREGMLVRRAYQLVGEAAAPGYMAEAELDGTEKSAEREGGSEHVA